MTVGRSGGRSTRTRGVGRIAVAIAALAVLTAACGTELSEAERARYLSTGGGTAVTQPDEVAGGGTGGSVVVGGGAGGTSDGSTGTGTVTDGSGTTGGDGSATTGGTTAGGPLPCAAKSTEVGVTDETITLGGVFQLSGPVTGFAQQFLTGVRAKIAQVNANGGVCGRKIEYLSRDDGFDAARHAAQTRELIPKVLAIAGSFSTVDNGGATALAGTNVPDVSIAGTPERGSLPNNISQSVFPKHPGKATETYKWFHQQGATKVALAYVSLASARNLMDIQQESLEASGIKVVRRIELSPTQFSYDATARDIANSGADMLFFLHELNAASAMAQALATTPNSLKFPMYSAFSYGDKFIKLAGKAAEGSITILPFVPYEEAAGNPATQELMRWIQRVAPGETPTFDAANGYTATGLLMQALPLVKGPITRDSVMAALRSIQDYDGGGVWANTHPASRSGGGSIIMVVKGGKWTRLAPAKGFINA